MPHFRAILLPAAGGVRAAGWVVEKSHNGEKVGVVSRLYPTRAEAKAEAERLNALEPEPNRQAQVSAKTQWLTSSTAQRIFRNPCCGDARRN